MPAVLQSRRDSRQARSFADPAESSAGRRDGVLYSASSQAGTAIRPSATEARVMAPPTLTNWLLGLVSALLALLITIAGWQFRAMDSRLEGIALSTTVM